MINDMLKDAFKSGLFAMLGYLLAMPALKKFRATLDPRKVNGGVLLGLNGVVVKSHGGADAEGFANAISVAADMGDSRFKAEIEDNLKRLIASASAPPAVAASEEAAK
jgi:glycerol-3-phosphate acyltransferase PlsX